MSDYCVVCGVQTHEVGEGFVIMKKLSGLEKFKPYRPGYHIYWGTMLLLWLLLLLTLIRNYTCGESLWSAWLVESGVSRFLPIASIQNMAETVGFGSILLAWIYAVLDRTELGLRYNDILKSVYPIYHYFVLSHLVGVLLCIGLSMAEVLDGALLALIIIIFGGGIHWKALSLLVFDSKKRRQKAEDEWKVRLIDKDIDQTYLSKLLTVPTVLHLEQDPVARNMLEYFRRGLLRYAAVISDYTQASHKQIKRILLELMQIWDELLRPRADNERLILTGVLLEGEQTNDCPKDEETGYPPLGAVCLGYVMCLYRLCREENVGISEEEMLWIVKQKLNLVRLRCDNQLAVRYLLISERLLAWISFYCGRTTFNSELFDVKGTHECPGDQAILKAMIDLLFQKQETEHIFALVYPQLFDTKDQA